MLPPKVSRSTIAAQSRGSVKVLVQPASAQGRQRRAGSLAPIEAPDAYGDVPRRVLGKDGVIRPLAPPPWAASKSVSAGYTSAGSLGAGWGATDPLLAG